MTNIMWHFTLKVIRRSIKKLVVMTQLLGWPVFFLVSMCCVAKPINSPYFKALVQLKQMLRLFYNLKTFSWQPLFCVLYTRFNSRFKIVAMLKFVKRIACLHLLITSKMRCHTIGVYLNFSVPLKSLFWGRAKTLTMLKITLYYPSHMN